MFCPKANVWDIVDKMEQIKLSLMNEQGCLEVVNLEERVKLLENYIQE
jgi:hypothetical protein